MDGKIESGIENEKSEGTKEWKKEEDEEEGKVKKEEKVEREVRYLSNEDRELETSEIKEGRK